MAALGCVMSRVRIGLTTVFLVSASLCAPNLFAQTATAQHQNAAPVASAKQIADDEEKNLVAAVRSVESSDDARKELTAKLEALARFYSSHNRKPELSAVLDRELAAADKTWPIGDPTSVRTLQQIASEYVLCNQRDLARQIYLRILEIDTRRYGINNVNVASDLVALGRTTMFIHDPSEAEAYFNRALAIDQLQKDDGAAITVVEALVSVAQLQKDYDKADAILVREIELLKLGGDHDSREISILLNDRSRIASMRGDSNASTELTKQSLELNERARGNNSVLNIAPLDVLADKYMHSGDLNSAELYALQALKVAESVENDSKHLAPVKPLTELGRIYRKEKKYAESEAAFIRAIDLVNHGRGADDASLADVTLQLAGLYSDEEKNTEAEAQYLRTIKLAENDTGYYGHNLPQYLAGYAYFLHKLNRDDEAKNYMKRAQDVQAGFRAAVQNQVPKN
jgi:tetratricopeptide (TPR) repeat protein